MRTCIWNDCLFDRFCVLKELWQIRFWDKLKLMQRLHELSNFVNDLLWWRCLDFLKFCCCSHVKLLRLRKKDTLQRIICPFCYRPDLFDKLDETPCFSHLLPMNIQLPFISHSLFKLFFTSKRLGVGGSAADGMAAAAPVRTTRQSLKVLYRGCKEVARKHVQQLIAVNIRFLDTYKHHQDATCQHPDKKSQLFYSLPGPVWKENDEFFAVCRASWFAISNVEQQQPETNDDQERMGDTMLVHQKSV